MYHTHKTCLNHCNHKGLFNSKQNFYYNSLFLDYRMLLRSANCWASLLCTLSFALPAVTGPRLQVPVPSQLSVLWPALVWKSAELKMSHLFLRTLLAGRVVVAVAVCRKNPPHGRSKRSPHFFSSVYTCGELTTWATSPCFDVSFERNTMECSCGKLSYRVHLINH
jgi:hypothetical protein